MDLGLEGKAALVTAGSKGIGLAVAEELAREGVNLLVTSRQEAHLEEAAKRAGLLLHEGAKITNTAMLDATEPEEYDA